MKKLIKNLTVSSCMLLCVSSGTLLAGTTWDGGGNATNTITTAANWDGDALPTFTGFTSNLTFGPGGTATSASINTNVEALGLGFTRTAQFSLTQGGASTLTVGSGGINTNGGSSNFIINMGLTMATNQVWDVAAAAPLRFSGGAITDGASTFGITKNGTGTLQLYNNAASTYDGVTSLNAGLISVQANSTLGSAVGNTVMQAGTTLTFNNTGAGVGDQMTINEEIVMQGAALSTLTHASGGTVIANSLTTQVGNISMDGAGDRTINTTSTSARFMGTVARTGANTGTLNLAIRNDNDFNRTMTFENAIDNNGGAVAISGRSQTGETFSATVVFNATGNDIGAVTLTSDVNRRVTLRIGADDALATTQNLTLTRGIFDLAGNDQTINALSGVAGNGTTGPTALITNSAASTTSVLTVGNGNGTGTMAGVIQNGSGIVALTKVGSGSLTLSASGNFTNTYTGNTTVSAGTLILADNSELRIDVNGVGSNTQILGSGTLTLNGDFRFDLTGASTAYGTTWQIVNATTLNETYSGTFQVFSTLGAFTNSSGTWTRNENGMDYIFTQSDGLLTVVPEPSTWVLLAGSLTALVVFRRRRVG